jgi:hypothetical protein
VQLGKNLSQNHPGLTKFLGVWCNLGRIFPKITQVFGKNVSPGVSKHFVGDKEVKTDSTYPEPTSFSQQNNANMGFIFTEPAYLLSQEVPSDLRPSFNHWVLTEMPAKFAIVTYSMAFEWFHENGIVPKTADPLANLPYDEALLQLDYANTCCRPSRVWHQGRFEDVPLDYDLVEGFSGHINSPTLWEQRSDDMTRLTRSTRLAEKVISEVLGYYL